MPTKMTPEMPPEPRLLFISGSAREGSLNTRLARLAFRIAEANGIAAAFADLGDYPLPIYDGDLEDRDGAPDNAIKLKHLISVHTGILIAAPEYNAGITPLLKNAIDWVSRVKENDEPAGLVYKTRVFALAAASPGGFGGMRGLIQLRQTLTLGLGALVLPDQVVIARATEAFDDDGSLKVTAQQEMVKDLVAKLARAARLLHCGDR